jgi:hypothetical protein
MSNKQKNDKIKFQIGGIELLESSIINSNKSIDEKNINFNINLEQKIDNDKKIVFVIADVSFNEKDEDKELGTIKTCCLFKIKSDDDLIDPKTKKFNLPDNIIMTLSTITLSTTRGIMFAQFKGTFLHHVILPLIDPATIKSSKV